MASEVASARMTTLPLATDSRLDEKTWSGWVARAAVAGFELRRLPGCDGLDVYIIRSASWNLMRELDDVVAIETFLRKAGAPT